MRDWLIDFAALNFEVLLLTHRFVVILPVPLWALQRIIEEYNIPLIAAELIYCDPSSNSFQTLRFNLKFDTRSEFKSVHAKTSVWQATWKGFSIGVRTGVQGDPRQQGGAFVIVPILRPDVNSNEFSKKSEIVPIVSYSCVWKHYDRHNSDQVEIPVLLRAAGIEDVANICRFLK